MPNEKKTVTPPALKAPKGDPPVNWISLFGFVIVTKADMLAAAAFLLSISTIVIQVTTWFTGSKPTVYAPDTVYVFFDQYANNKIVMRLAGQLSFVNTGPVGHDAIVRDVIVNVKVGKLDLDQRWLSFASVSRDENRLVVTPREMAHPFPVSSGSAVSQMISFSPVEDVCSAEIAAKSPDPKNCVADRGFVSDTDFLETASKAKELTLTFSVRYVGKKERQDIICKMPIGEAFVQYLAENSWFSSRCFAKDSE
ncbi:hypothetical protein [Sphingobium boeckii]|uniref:Uncharacterized protein n=1 Tax=Sphingobium boeckii TaxID=1082345 RepID=A0A7W9ED98_9SPHN|nr:hypothetical protein [Sphingobium boeckii]MBB5684887.1 hypothetical protein [Sphingobium boeckii]